MFVSLLQSELEGPQFQIVLVLVDQGCNFSSCPTTLLDVEALGNVDGDNSRDSCDL